MHLAWGCDRRRQAHPALRLGAQAKYSFHMIALDGAYVVGTEPPVFRRIASPREGSCRRLERLAQRIGRALERRGRLVRDAESSFPDSTPWPGGLIDDLLSHSITYRVAAGPRARRGCFRYGR
jgi:hypothetical protein